MSEQTALSVEQDTVLNGVNVTQLVATIGVIEENSEIAKFKFRNHNKWIDGGQNRSTIDKFYGAMEEHSRENPFVMDNDEPPVLLGTDMGANPVEQILHGLAGCITTTTIYYAAAKGIKIDEMETIFVGDLDLRGFLGLPGRTRNGYEQIRVTVKIKSDASEDDIRELIELAQRRSPVYDIVTNPVPVSINLERI